MAKRNRTSLYQLLGSFKKNKILFAALVIFALTSVAVLGFSIFRLTSSKLTTVYAKVKVSQGLWWSATQKPPIWFIDALKKGDTEYDYLGRPIAEIIDVRYYPGLARVAEQYESEYNVYLTLRLNLDYNKSSQKYFFKRSAIGVSSPIELELSSVQVSGTIIELSENMLEDSLIQKTITLTKKLAYPWEFEAIKVGDSYFDGKEKVFEVLGKRATATSTVDVDSLGNVNLGTRDQRRYIMVAGTIRLKQKGGQLIFGEEQVIKPGSDIKLATTNFFYQGFVVESIK